MKTTKIFLSIALVALATTSFAQRSSIKDRLFPNNTNQIEFVTADYNITESTRIENWVHDLHSWSSSKYSRNAYEAPEVSRTIFLEQVEVVYEENLELESWMTNTFECGLCEEEIFVESWMNTPFESRLVEEDLFLESWMVVPFESTEVSEVEDWMVCAWI